MERVSVTKAIGATIFGWINQALEVYLGPVLVAFMAVVARMMYAHDEITFRAFINIWSVSAFVSFIVLHLLQWKHIDHDLSVAIWGASAFLGREICDASLYVAKRGGRLILARVKNVNS